ncbi:DNA recombination protein rmuC [Candidatus Photodesmus blepharus]|uniref:DNA recombination protein rmuC n=1 Tax=Candidatus Photodesmus blepharonis TaxID=1179155 RepID=A0A084CNR7_9GAMM|nr:DNA recombination protein RmuC [Candidatus Photodesmus blepharus]KEY91446.1 DNA recombination protein rmuC [Candidatus Photodesmus blepharus]
MQWIIDNQNLLIGIGGVAILLPLVSYLAKQKIRLNSHLLEQQLISNQKIYSDQLEKIQKTLTETEKKLSIERDKSAYELKESHGKLMAMTEKLRSFSIVKQECQQYADDLNEMRENKFQLETRLREQEVFHEQKNKANLEKLQLLEKSEEHLKQQFKHLADELFEEKTNKIDQQNKQSLEIILSPIKEQLEGFKKQVNDNFNQEAKERHALVHELKSLQRLNEQITREAVNLTQALKGNNKQQGNWGEIVLARILTESGLREGHEYQTQVSLQNEIGKTYKPDIIVHLPQNKQVIIDSKMVLIAFERYFNAESDKEKESALTNHLSALRTHIKGLSLKDYNQLKGIHSLDYVLMFIPVESAFQLAVQADPNLIRDAIEKNIILVSPTTLLITLRTIHNLWQNEKQSQNTRIIADKASKLYNKIRLFVDDMENIGRALDKAHQNYQDAMNKLATGRGNIIRQVESFKQLGIEVKCPISNKLSELSKNQTLPRDKP